MWLDIASPERSTWVARRERDVRQRMGPEGTSGLGVDDEDGGGGGVADDVVRDGADEGATEAGAAVGGDDDEVAVLIEGLLGDEGVG